jgi:predicted transcriptional regulator
MMRTFTLKRTELLEKLTQDGKQPINLLATKLKRKRTAVSRDVGVLRRMGVLSTLSVSNPGHGKILMVSPLAKRYEFVWSVGARAREVTK